MLHASASSKIVISQADFDGIRGSDGSDGFLAILDSAAPVNWLVIPATREKLIVDRAVSVATLRADRDRAWSDECTNEFLDLVIEERERLLHLTYATIAQRALNGESL